MARVVLIGLEGPNEIYEELGVERTGSRRSIRQLTREENRVTEANHSLCGESREKGR